MASDFLLQIVNRHTSQVVATWEPGSWVEADLVASVLERLTNVGVFRTEAQVKEAVRKAWSDSLHELKAAIHPPV